MRACITERRTTGGRQIRACGTFILSIALLTLGGCPSEEPSGTSSERGDTAECEQPPGSWPAGDGLAVYLDFGNKGTKDEAYFLERGVGGTPIVRSFALAELDRSEGILPGAEHLPDLDLPDKMGDQQAASKIQGYIQQCFSEYGICFHSSYFHEPPIAPRVVVYIGSESKVNPGNTGRASHIGMEHPPGDDEEYFAVVSAPNIASEMNRLAGLGFLSAPDGDDVLWGVACTVAHELGHLLGLRHTNTSSDLMSNTFEYRILRAARFQRAPIKDGSECDGTDQDAPAILLARLGPAGSHSCEAEPHQVWSIAGTWDVTQYDPDTGEAVWWVCMTFSEEEITSYIASIVAGGCAHGIDEWEAVTYQLTINGKRLRHIYDIYMMPLSASRDFIGEFESNDRITGRETGVGSGTVDVVMERYISPQLLLRPVNVELVYLAA